MSVLTLRARRRPLRERLVIGMRLRHRRDGSEWSVWQVHRKDHLAELRGGEGLRRTETFSDITVRYEEIEP